MERVEITQPFVSLIMMQVCAVEDASDEEILAVANKENPCGTTLGWCEVVRTMQDAPALIDEIKKMQLPAPCDTHTGRIHYLVTC